MLRSSYFLQKHETHSARRHQAAIKNIAIGIVILGNKSHVHTPKMTGMRVIMSIIILNFPAPFPLSVYMSLYVVEIRRWSGSKQETWRDSQ